MGFVFTSKNIVSLVYVGFAGVCLLTLLIILWIAFLRVRMHFRQQYEVHFREIWQPIFKETALQTYCHTKDAKLPTLKRRDFFLFITHWVEFQENFSGSIFVRMGELARKLGVQDYARRLMRQGNLRRRLLAVVFLGDLRDRASWPDLEQFLSHENSLLSILAARSLLKIDQERALPLVFAEVIRREDWPETRVALRLRSVLNADQVTGPLFEALRDSSDAAALKLLPYVEHMYNEERNRILRILLERSESDRLTSRILKLIDCDDERDLVRGFLGHERWHIRMQAVSALGRIGERGDIPLLLEALGDKEWWVRYRAAQALLKMPGMTREKLQVIHDNLEDSFARNMLEQTLIEEGGAA